MTDEYDAPLGEKYVEHSLGFGGFAIVLRSGIVTHTRLSWVGNDHVYNEGYGCWGHWSEYKESFENSMNHWRLISAIKVFMI